jgi:hypothetical protein
MTQIFLYAGVTSFPNPGDWDAVANKVECLGSGCRGGWAVIIPNVRTAKNAAGGGGGGGYGYAENLNPAFPVAVNVGLRDRSGIFNTQSPSNTYWDTWALAPGGVQGYCGGTVSMTTGGAGGSFYPIGYSGGWGGRGTGAFSTPGGGGGGSAGPHGNGVTGWASVPSGPEMPPEDSPAGFGGAADGYTVPGAVGLGVNGLSGTQWDALHGCGSGGSSSPVSPAGVLAGIGGSYGGGGGGQAGESTAGAPGSGADGLLIITYTPRPPNRRRVVMMT